MHDLEAHRIQRVLPFTISLVDELNANNVTPILTQHYHDLPPAPKYELDRQAWLNINDSLSLEDYTTIMLKESGNKTKFWTTFDVPAIVV